LVRLAAGWSPSWVVADFVPGVAFLICGSLAWLRRPASRIGPLMIAAGFAWYAGTYGASMNPLIDRVAYGFQGWFEVFLAALVLSYPSGFLRSPWARLVIGSLIGLYAIRTVVRLSAFHVSTDYNLSDALDIERYVADATFRSSADTAFGVAVAVVAVVILVLVVNRLRTETDLGRRVAGPILLGGIAFASAIVVDTLTLASAEGFAERSSAWDLGQALTVTTGSLLAVGFLYGLARSRLARGAVADLVVELGQSADPRDLQSLLARALRDPSLQIAHAVGPDRFVDADGRPVALPPPDDGRRAVTRLDVGGQTIAALIHDVALVERPELVQAVAAAAGLALENERLAADVRAQLDEVRRSRARIVAAGDAERRRIERDIHDGAQQQLVTVALLLQMARAGAESDSELATTVDRAAAELESALAELRRLARGLHPVVLVEEGLAAAVQALADRTTVPVSADVTAERFPAHVEATAYFVVAEALTNVVRHARAHSVVVTIERRDGHLGVEVVDDGVGGADQRRGSGLLGLEDRVAAAGGRLTVRSEAGTGTMIRAEVPCE
jgi:signal transduction histidine kinase